VASPPVILRKGVRLELRAEGLRLTAEDYHCPPVHLTASDLASIGLALDRRVAPPSVALPWAASLKVPADRTEPGPASDPGWAMPAGVQVGDFLVCRVAGGLDLFVTCHNARPVILSDHQATQLGLHHQGERSLA
jgi:hypothetical protein